MNDPLLTRLLSAAFVATLAVSALFAGFPQLDIAISALFADGMGHFPMHDRAFFQSANDLLKLGLNLFFCAAVLIWLHGLIRPGASARPQAGWRFLALVWLLCPGVIVNLILKPGFGRPRPFQTSDFGGQHPFAPMLEVTDACGWGCSFPSGEVALTSSFAFALLLLAWPRLSSPGRVAAGIGAAALICASILLRLGLGRHFASDALFSVGLSAMVTVLVWSTLRHRSGHAPKPGLRRAVTPVPMTMR